MQLVRRYIPNNSAGVKCEKNMMHSWELRIWELRARKLAQSHLKSSVKGRKNDIKMENLPKDRNQKKTNLNGSKK